MPFEEIDKKIRDAADNHHPAYDEKAWDKMESLLNKHMPEKKERKRRAALWLLLLLITAGGAGYFLITKNNTGKPGTVVNNNTSPKNTTTEKTINQEKPISNELSQNESNTTKDPAVPGSLLSPAKQLDQNQPLTIITTGRNNTKSRLFQKTGDLNKPGHFSGVDQPLTINPSPSINTSEDKISVPPVSKDHSDIKPAEKEKQVKDLTAEADSKLLERQTENTRSKKTKTKKGNGLFISLSAGPDVGVVELNSIGRLKLAAGIGIGYKISNRFSLQTGFYTSRKIYTAQAYDYNAPGWWWNYYPTLESVNADCKVYEIPLLVNYSFTKNKKSNWFATTGLSSYLMKKEEYNYNYKTSAGLPATRRWVYNNANKHYFSVLTLAGGYERNLNKQLSLSFSPYFKIPLNGVGFGKVKLNSAGVLVSVNFKPFVKK